MKRSFFFTLYLLALSLLSGYMLSKVSFIGRAGISVFYTSYTFLKVWWQAAAVVFIALLLLYGIQYVIYTRANERIAKGAQVTSLFLAITGLILSYNDFRDDISHRWLGERFHIGVYLFWFGWISISIFLLLQKKKGNVITSSRTDDLIV
ncbi:MAG: cytochrome d ubiquinol oxidase subunit II [Sphingobacteriales bacterium]|nr:MAG: cytochrome d ubiquinol oxidase subunit II [Sphingobacteriales bacterium]